MILIKNGLVVTGAYAKPQIMDLWIAEGKVAKMLPVGGQNADTETNQFSKVIDAGGKIVAPGLINAHTHSYANYFKTAADNLPLEEMMFFIMAEGDCLKAEDVYYNTMLGAIEMVRGGITCCLDQLAQSAEGLDAAMTAYDEIGMRATVAPMISDMGYYETLPVGKELVPDKYRKPSSAKRDALLQTSVDFLKKWHGKGQRLQVGFGPSGPQRCTIELLQGCMKNAIEYDTIFHTHTLETRTQKNTAHLMFGKGMVEFLDDIGCLNDRTSMAHGVWITKPEAELAAAKGASVVHCPACNMYLGSGIAPVNMFRAVGFNVGLGTDGPNGGCNQSMLETMKIAGLLHRPAELNFEKWLTAYEAWKMGTVNNAKVLRLDKEVGTIEVGKRADVVIYNPQKSMALQPLTDPVMQLAFGETGNAVETVIVEGQVVLEDGEFTTIDEKSALKAIQQHSEAVNNRLQAKYATVMADVETLKKILPRDF